MYALRASIIAGEVEQLLIIYDIPLFGTLSHDEILKTVEKDKNKEVDVSEKPNEGPSHSEAYSCLKVGFIWLEQ
ncbi:hypothetical protein T4E_585 [Trichinella pseudospiralis]|uniref:Uncharacterized protein n=1 Tax=Trichinella pseudospiralis TaxID=6337 RepID=A0A0V0YMR5_TRIPS|nr:hypothetical protein T4E_585 [Trichinella pseudospiralis]